MPPFIFLYCTFFILSTSSVLGIAESVFDKIKLSLENAKGYFETAKNIANLVSKSLKHKQTHSNKEDNIDNNTQEHKPDVVTNLVSTFFRVLGLDSRKVTAVTVNSFIFFAQMISELFKLSPKDEHLKAEVHKDIFSLIRLLKESENKKLQILLKQARHESLPGQLIEGVKGGDSSCVRLLLCKSSPFIWAAQKSLQNISTNLQRDINSWLPSKSEFEEYSDVCDDRYTDCPISYS